MDLERFKEIVQHPIVQSFSLVLGALGIIAAFIFYRLGKREKKPYWAGTGNRLIRNFSTKLPELEIKYRGENVEDLTITAITFWNAGRETIDGTDLAEADQLRIVPTNAAVKILDAAVVQANSAPSKLTAHRISGYGSSPTEVVLLSFDFLDKDQGGVIQVIHTGQSVKDVVLTGTIKGAGQAKKVEPYIAWVQVMGFTLSVFLMLSFAVLLADKRYGLGWGSIILFVLAMVVQLRLSVVPLMRTPKSLR